jgi:hypothetical protein
MAGGADACGPICARDMSLEYPLCKECSMRVVDIFFLFFYGNSACYQGLCSPFS